MPLAHAAVTAAPLDLGGLTAVVGSTQHGAVATFVGVVRNHDPEIMVKAFEMVRLGEEDVKKKFPNKTGHDSDEMRRLRKKYGVKLDQWQEMVEDDDGVYVNEGQNAPDEEYDEVNRDGFTQPEEEE